MLKCDTLDEIVQKQTAKISNQIESDNTITKSVGFGLGGLIALVVIAGVGATALSGKKKKNG